MPPLAPFVPAIIGAGATIGGGLLGRPRQSQAEKRALGAQTRLAGTQERLLGERGEREAQLFGQARPVISDLLAQFTDLLGGDRAALARRFAPLLEDIRTTGAQTRENILGSIPAGGAQVAGLIGTEQGVARQRQQVLGGAPAQGAAGLTQLLNLLLGAGSAQASAASQAGAGAASSLQSILASEGANKLLTQQFFENLVSGAENIGIQLAQGGQPERRDDIIGSTPSTPGPEGTPRRQPPLSQFV